MSTFKTRLLSNLDIEKLITQKEVVDAVERTWSECALGKVVNPPKLSLDLGESGAWPNYSGHMNAMPAYVGWLDVAGLKWAGGFWNNIHRGIPSVCGMILLIEPKTGQFRAVLDGSLITALRTAAQSVVGIKYLAAKNFTSIGIYGAGTQVRYHTLMFSKYFPSSEVRVYDIRRELVEELVQEFSNKFDMKIIPCNNPQEPSKADVIITLTSSKTPFIRAEWVRRGQLVIALGSYQEIYPEVIRKADKIVVDQLQQALHRGALKVLADKGEITDNEVYATIGEIVAGLKAGRRGDEEIIFFEPIGTGMLDVAVAAIAYNKAVEQGIGQEFRFFGI